MRSHDPDHRVEDVKAKTESVREAKREMEEKEKEERREDSQRRGSEEKRRQGQRMWEKLRKKQEDTRYQKVKQKEQWDEETGREKQRERREKEKRRQKESNCDRRKRNRLDVCPRCHSKRAVLASLCKASPLAQIDENKRRRRGRRNRNDLSREKTHREKIANKDTLEQNVVHTARRKEPDEKKSEQEAKGLNPNLLHFCIDDTRSRAQFS